MAVQLATAIGAYLNGNGLVLHLPAYIMLTASTSLGMEVTGA